MDLMEKMVHEFSEKVAKAKNDLLKSLLAKHGFCYDDVFEKKVMLYALGSMRSGVTAILHIVKDGKIIDCVDIFEETELIDNIMNYTTWAKKHVKSDLKYEELLEIRCNKLQGNSQTEFGGDAMKIEWLIFILITALLVGIALFFYVCEAKELPTDEPAYRYPNYNLEELREVSKESGLTGYVGGVIEELQVTVFVYVKDD